MMNWSADSAKNAFLDTLRLCHEHEAQCSPLSTTEPESKEFISALAAGMNAKLMVEVTPEVSSSTVALAAAARQTGGKLVCILSEPKPDEYRKVIEESPLNEMVEFKTGDPCQLLTNYKNIDFSLVHCNTSNYRSLLELLDVNPRKSMVVADHLVDGRLGLEGHVKGMEGRREVRSMMHPIGDGMEITMIGKSDDHLSKIRRQSRGGSRRRVKSSGGSSVKRGMKSKWVTKVDEKSGEEHVYRMLTA